MKRKRFSEEQIIAVLREHDAGAKAVDLARNGKLVSGYVRGAGTKTLIVVTPPMEEGVQSEPYVIVDDGKPPAM
jgi:hypothetical protein